MQRVSSIINQDVSTLPKRTMVSILLYGKEGMAMEEIYLLLTIVVYFIAETK